MAASCQTAASSGRSNRVEQLTFARNRGICGGASPAGLCPARIRMAQASKLMAPETLCVRGSLQNASSAPAGSW